MADSKIAKTYKLPEGVTYDSKDVLTQAEYDALTLEEKKELGFIHDEDVVYQTVEDKVENFSGEKKYTLEAVGTVTGEKTKIPVGTKIHGMEETHFNFNGVKPE